jgi:phosphoglucomutase
MAAMTDRSERAGKPAEPSMLVNVAKLVTAYYAERPDPSLPVESISFGTSGHRGSAFRRSFNERHVLATTQAICDYRRHHGIDGPLFLGIDTHALSEPARVSALEVLAANAVDVEIDERDGFTPTPVVSHAILAYNRSRLSGLADGIVLSPSHNPPEDGGFKYNPPHGGPADTDVTGWVERRANEILEGGLKDVARVPYQRALSASTTHRHDFVGAYVSDLASAIDFERMRGVRIGVDPLGGASVALFEPIAERYQLDVEVVNDVVDPTFRFMTVDWDGKIRMDCSSPFAMARLIELKDRFDVAFANDTDSDRHGIVTRSAGLLNPNHFLAAAVSYLFSHRPDFRRDAAIGKTVVTSSILDRVAEKLGRKLVEVPVGFKWFVSGLLDGSLGFGGEESAGASFLRRDGTVWTTDKDGILLGLLAAEMTAVTGRDPGELYREIEEELGRSAYERIDSRATPAEKRALKNMSASSLDAGELGGDPIRQILTEAPGNGAPIGGLKVATEHGWFAARPSGTEDVYKLYAESFRDENHLRRIQDEARALVTRLLANAAP